MANHYSETRPVTSREYKLMLRAKRFDGSTKDVLAAAERFRIGFVRAIANRVESAVGLSSVDGSFERLNDKKQVAVQFFDTKDRRLRNASFVFRQRQPIAGGPLELTLKRRHADRFYVSGSETGRKTKFEEDIKATQTQAFSSLHSLSGTVKDVAAETEFRSLKDIQQFYKPFKKQLGKTYNASENLLRVCNFTAIQSVLEGMKFQISDKCDAQAALILWHQQGGDDESPAVVELSFRCRVKKLDARKELFTAATAKRCFDVFQSLCADDSPIAEWVDLNSPTKTAYAYGLTRL